MTSKPKPERLLVTGAAGFIGSHFCVEAAQAGYELLAIDNLSNSSRGAIRAVEQITQRTLPFEPIDLREERQLHELLAQAKVDAVVHFAGLKAVGESTDDPLAYYDNNVQGTLSLLNAMAASDCRTLVFSSSATVYGTPQKLPLVESHPTGALNPYGRTKLMIEEILRDLHQSDERWRISLLRYFNPVGAHASGELGEAPNDVPNNLMPYIAQVAVGRRDELAVYGDDYDTPDGTGVRDYIHVVDLVRGHLKALDHLAEAGGCQTHNLGTGRGYSVLEAIGAFEAASGKKIPYRVAPRRSGDAASSYADASRAEQELGWRAQFDLKQMCEDSWRWQSRHPYGYDESP